MTLITLNALENLKLMMLEQLCPYTEDTAVYQARGLLRYFDDSTYYSNPCELATPPTPPGSGSRFANTGANANDLAKGYNTAVFPNPASNEISITTELEGASIQLYTILGQLVLESKLNSETKLSLINLSSGSYIYKIVKDNNLIKTEKILINK